jgi:hypothetical protein
MKAKIIALAAPVLLLVLLPLLPLVSLLVSPWLVSPATLTSMVILSPL